VRQRYRSGLLGTTASKVFDCSLGQAIRVDIIWVSNISGSGRTFDLYQVADGETASTANAIAYQVAVAANTAVRYEGPFYFVPGDSLQAIASATSAVNVHAYGVEVQAGSAESVAAPRNNTTRLVEAPPVSPNMTSAGGGLLESY
tara:strand:- start:345 stop:779 length:435 start_codon:yes stop_codon:yes gene_type:complete